MRVLKTEREARYALAHMPESTRKTGYVYIEKHTLGYLIAVYKMVSGKWIFHHYYEGTAKHENR